MIGGNFGSAWNVVLHACARQKLAWEIGVFKNRNANTNSNAVRKIMRDVPMRHY
jgi:hypothetical protein